MICFVGSGGIVILIKLVVSEKLAVMRPVYTSVAANTTVLDALYTKNSIREPAIGGNT